MPITEVYSNGNWYSNTSYLDSGYYSCSRSAFKATDSKDIKLLTAGPADDETFEFTDLDSRFGYGAGEYLDKSNEPLSVMNAGVSSGCHGCEVKTFDDCHGCREFSGNLNHPMKNKSLSNESSLSDESNRVTTCGCCGSLELAYDETCDEMYCYNCGEYTEVLVNTL